MSMQTFPAFSWIRKPLAMPVRKGRSRSDDMEKKRPPLIE